MFDKPAVHAKPSVVTNSFVGTEEYIAPEVATHLQIYRESEERRERERERGGEIPTQTETCTHTNIFSFHTE